MKITPSMVELMNAFRIGAMCKDSIDELRELYNLGLRALGSLSKDETMTPEQTSSVTDFFSDVIRNEEARIENN